MNFLRNNFLESALSSCNIKFMNLFVTSTANFSQKSNTLFSQTQIKPSSGLEVQVSDKNQIKEVVSHVNNLVANPFKHQRLFAVVMIGGSQFKITTEDIIMVKNQFYPTIGDRIRLEKVLLIGGKDFTVFGKPILDKSFVNIEATVIEKTLSNNVILFRYKPRKDNRRMNFHRGIQTMLRINSIDITGPIPGTASDKVLNLKEN